MEIIEIKQTSPERLTVIFDDGSQIKTTLGIATEWFLYSGKELTEDELLDLQNASSLSLAKSRALKILNSRPMSRKEMRVRLIEKGESPENAEICADWLCEMGLINDKTYSGMVVRHYSAKGYGIVRIRQELKRHGVPRELWEEALCEIPAQDDRLERFIRSRLNDPNDKVQIKKVSDALFRRGYTWDQIKHALNDFKAQEDYYE